MLAVGGQLKSTFALGRGQVAIISHHLGDLDDYQAYRAFERDIALYEQLFDTQPALIVRDLHPDYASSRYALRAPRPKTLRPWPCSIITPTSPLAWPSTVSPAR